MKRKPKRILVVVVKWRHRANGLFSRCSGKWTRRNKDRTWESGGNLAYRDYWKYKSCLSIYFIKSKRTPAPPPLPLPLCPGIRSPPAGVDFVVPQATTIPPVTRSLHTLPKRCLSVGEGRFPLFFLIYGYSNFRAPHSHQPTPPKSDRGKESFAEGLGTRCEFNSIWPTSLLDPIKVSVMKNYKKNWLN